MVTTPSAPSHTERVSAWSALASAAIALMAAVASTVSAFFGVNASRELADAQRQDAARTEISQYVVQMSELDRTGGSGRRNEIVTLARQVDSLVSQYGQSDLHLSASTYRLVGLFLTLSTTDLELAGRMATRALELAARPEPDSAGALHMADPLEALQAHRVLADVAAQNLDFPKMSSEYRTSLAIAEREGMRNRYIRIEAQRFTRVYWALSAMQLVDALGNPTGRQCEEVRHRAAWARADFQALGNNPEVVRRANRIGSDKCGTEVDLDRLKRW